MDFVYKLYIGTFLVNILEPCTYFRYIVHTWPLHKPSNGLNYQRETKTHFGQIRSIVLSPLPKKSSREKIFGMREYWLSLL